jgi:hypothetical protein
MEELTIRKAGGKELAADKLAPRSRKGPLPNAVSPGPTQLGHMTATEGGDAECTGTLDWR